MPERFDAAVVGMGPGGEVVASRLLAEGLRVAVVEAELIGGECAYWACIPSKTLLRTVETRAETQRTAGTGEAPLAIDDAFAYRDFMVRRYDDRAQVAEYTDKGATVLRGRARLTGPGVVEVDGEVLEAGSIVVATGSEAVIPSIPGLDTVPVWTNREATSLVSVPASAVVLGGGPVGVELAQLLARLGSIITLVHRGDRLLPRSEPRVSELVADALRADGVTVQLGVTVEAATSVANGARVHLTGGTEVDCEVVVAATGRRPRVDDLGLEAAGAHVTDRGVVVDARCQAAPGLWAIGDVTGQAMFTHVAKYQGRIAAAAILGRPRAARYDGIPRVVFCDPEVAFVGVTVDEAKAERRTVASTVVDIADAIARPWTYQRDPRGELGLVADLDRGTLVGAWAVAPLASEWIHTAAQAIRAEIPLDVLVDSVAQFPTYTEAYLAGFEQLAAAR